LHASPKHLAGSRISDISSPSYERIIEISVQTVDELGDRKDKKLIIEMMGRYSNIILMNSENRIFDSLLHVDSQMSRVREIMPARPYEYPPVQGKILPSDALAMLSAGELPLLPEASSRPLERALQESLMGFSPLLSREICYLSGVDARKGIRQLLPDEKSRNRRGRVPSRPILRKRPARPRIRSKKTERRKNFTPFFLKMRAMPCITAPFPKRWTPCSAKKICPLISSRRSAAFSLTARLLYSMPFINSPFINAT
jgi:predicted ribosome quality control (RQC) complex YloA/Tae2 family protein